MQPLIVVPANDIDAAGMDLTVDLPQGWLDGVLADAGARAKKPGHFKARLSRSGKADVVVRGKVAAELELPCARCLGPAPSDVDTEIALLLKPRPGAPPTDDAGRAKNGKTRARASTTKTATAKKPTPGREYEFSSGEADMDEYDGEKVVLDDFVREAIMLELPSFPLCREDCEGGARGKVEDAPAERTPAGTNRPFAALKHLLGDGGPPSDDTPGNVRPQAADLRRISRAKKREKPKIRTSAHNRKK